MTLNLEGHSVIFMPIDALSVLCAQLTRDLLAIAKFLFETFAVKWPKFSPKVEILRILGSTVPKREDILKLTGLKTSVLETIRKPPLVKAKSALKNKNIKYINKRFSIWQMELLHTAMWHDHDTDFAR